MLTCISSTVLYVVVPMNYSGRRSEEQLLIKDVRLVIVTKGAVHYCQESIS